MASTALHPITLDEFSQLPNLEESPAWEFLNGQVVQEPMPTFHHSCLQKRLVTAIDHANSLYEAFPELRCVFSQNSIVPDITVIHQSRIPEDNQASGGAPN
jgi:Uma2 family endonuclease